LVTRYVDVEAAEGDRDESDESNEDEDFLGVCTAPPLETRHLSSFAEDDDVQEGLSTRVSRRVPRWRDLESDPELLEKLAQDIRNRHAHPPMPELICESVVHPPPDLADPGIWRVRVKVHSSIS
jgi:hypothetical protein